MTRNKRDLIAWVSGAAIATLLITPAGAHVGGAVSHLWSHLKPKVTGLVYTKDQSDARYLRTTGTAVDADELDGMDSSEFLGVSDKAADADKIDGLDSTDLRTSAEPTRIIGAPGSLTNFNFGNDFAWCNWTVFAGDHAAPGFYKDGDGVVHLQGVIKAVDGTESACGAKLQDYIMFNLPEGFRPETQHVFSVVAGNNLGRINIEANGDVRMQSIFGGSWDHARSFMQLDGIEFRIVTST